MNWKKLISILLTLSLVLSLGIVATDAMEGEDDSAETVAEAVPAKEAPAEPQTGVKPCGEEEKNPAASSAADFVPAEFYTALLQAKSVEEAEALLRPLKKAEQTAFEAYLNAPENKAAAEALLQHMEELSENRTEEREEPESYRPVTVNVTEAGPFLPAVQLAAAGRRQSKAAKQEKSGKLTDPDDNGIVTNKTVKVEDGKYRITIEAYTTGKVTSVEQSVPADIVLVLDQSGSMADGFNGEGSSYSDSRQKAMQEAVENFIGEVNKKYSKEADHRMALVTFSEKAKTVQNWISVDHDGAAKLKAETQALGRRPSGGTHTEEGLKKAERLMTEDYAYNGKNTLRQKVVVVFTDGQPGDYGFALDRANKAIGSAKRLKDSGCTVYSIGIFDGANPDELCGSSRAAATAVTAESWAKDSGVWEDYKKDFLIFEKQYTGLKNTLAGIKNPEEGQEYLFTYAVSLREQDQLLIYHEGTWYLATESNLKVKGKQGKIGYWWSGEGKDIPAANRFMNFLSSNYRDADELGLTEKEGGWEISKNFPRTAKPEENYYLSADNAGALNNIFQRISQQISTPTVDLGKDTVITDGITPYFTAPEKAEVKIYTADYAGENRWEERKAAADVKTSVDDKKLTVTGFDYTENFVSENPKPDGSFGRKLIVQFTVKPEEGFLGGNNVPTNTGNSGISNGSAGEKFPVPCANVPLKEVRVSAEDKNVYLNGKVSPEEMKKGAAAQAGEVAIDLHRADYGLQDWQHEFVEIDTAVEPEEGYENLTEDKTYKAVVTVTPKEAGEKAEGKPAEAQSGTSEKAKINVFQPELTFKDSLVWYGDKAPENPADFEKNNKVGETVWKHGKTRDDSVTMLGKKPELALTYAPKPGQIRDSRIQTKKDIPVKAEVKVDGRDDLTEKVLFRHQDCKPDCGWESPVKKGDPAFLLHVRTCRLTLTKTGGAEREPYVFTVNRNGRPYTEARITGNDSITFSELPVGEYSIDEDSGWSWRYSGKSSSSVKLNAMKPSGSITCENHREEEQWLDAFSAAAKNIFHRGEAIRKAGDR